MTDDAHAFARQLYDEYGAAFSGLDPDASTDYWYAPSIRVDPGGVRLDATAADRRAGFVAAIDDLRATDYDHSESAAMTSHRLSPSLALSSVVWERLTGDGTVMARFSPIHLLRRTDDGWRFLARATRRSTEPLAMRPADDEPGEQHPGVASTLEAHGRALAAGDSDALARHWSLPALVATADRVRAVTTTAELAALVEEGPVPGGTLERVHVHESDDGVAVADAVWRRDGERTATLHLLHEGEAGWEVLLAARHPAEHAVSLGV